MKGHIFVIITETQEEREDLSKINYNTCAFEQVHFYNAAFYPQGLTQSPSAF